MFLTFYMYFSTKVKKKCIRFFNLSRNEDLNAGSFFLLRLFQNDIASESKKRGEGNE